MDRSFSPFSESGVALMPNGHLQRLVVTPDSQQQSWTESVYTLIQETEEAFKSVGDSLKDDTGPNSWFADPSESISSSVAEIHPEHSHPDSSGHHELGQSTPPKRIQVSPLNKPLPPHPENRKEKVVPAKKTKRKEPKKKTVLPLCGLPGTGSSSKWTMRNGVSQILSGTLFKRVEADEMLTSDQIDQIRTRRLQVRDNKHSSFDGRSWMDCARSVRSQSPALHRNGAQAGVVSQRANSPTSPLDNAVVHKDFSSPEKSYGESEQVCEGQDQQGDAALSPNNAAASSPPPKNPEKHFYNNKSRAKLPTIPEATITAAGGTVGRTSGAVSARSDSSLAPVCRTGTSPSGVRSSPHHGRTACGKAEASTDDRDDAPEDSVDKTSFQVATLCIEDDLKEALYEYDGEESETEEELVDWFENLGIPHGDLVSDRASPPWNSPSYSVDSRFTSKVGSDKNPLLRKPSEKHRPLPAEPMRFFTNRSPPRKWTPENLSPDRYTLRAAVRGTFRPTADRLYI
ncbi:hypothetical protein QQS21_010970 [Conoideocrella luteorostrata]|uniref:Uncharacterized protein n=1 Tax=Conoideocrella luteorostrata TaxID=1105319 RepID=A0AAJ0FWB9_9HYPO|nr:hypothetical protein QQS21_010970 [Conoideocrella luteorostrata]